MSDSTGTDQFSALYERLIYRGNAVINMAGRKQNVGRRDRIVRAILTPIILLSAFWLYNSVPHNPVIIAVVAGAVVFAFISGTGAITGTCGVYAALGIDTCRCEGEYAGGNTWG